MVNKKVNIAGISSFDALARSYNNNINICVAVKASPGFIYIQWFSKHFIPTTDIEVFDLEKNLKLPFSLENIMFIGNGSEILAEKINFKGKIMRENLITPGGLFNSINNLILKNIHIDATPLYLKNSNILEPSRWKNSPIV